MHVTLSQHIVLHIFLFGTAVRAVMYATVPQHIDSPEFSETDPCKGSTCMVTQCVWLAIHAAREQHETKKPDQLVTEQRGQIDTQRTDSKTIVSDDFARKPCTIEGEQNECHNETSGMLLSLHANYFFMFSLIYPLPLSSFTFHKSCMRLSRWYFTTRKPLYHFPFSQSINRDSRAVDLSNNAF